MPRLTEKLKEYLAQQLPCIQDHCSTMSSEVYAQLKHLIKNYPEACVPDEALCLFRDGNRWCCVRGDFIELQESQAIFGETPEEAMEAMMALQIETADRIVSESRQPTSKADLYEDSRL